MSQIFVVVVEIGINGDYFAPSVFRVPSVHALSCSVHAPCALHVCSVHALAIKVHTECTLIAHSLHAPCTLSERDVLLQYLWDYVNFFL